MLGVGRARLDIGVAAAELVRGVEIVRQIVRRNAYHVRLFDGVIDILVADEPRVVFVLAVRRGVNRIRLVEVVGFARVVVRNIQTTVERAVFHLYVHGYRRRHAVRIDDLHVVAEIVVIRRAHGRNSEPDKRRIRRSAFGRNA